jgi:hypothetical protein
VERSKGTPRPAVWKGGECVVFLSRMGKGAETGVDILECAGGRLHYTALASEMGIKRARTLFRAGGWFSKLEEAGVVEFSPETGEVSLTSSWLEAWNVRREQDGEIEDYRRDVKAHELRRAAWHDHLKELREERRNLSELEGAAEDEQCRELLNEMDKHRELIRGVTHLVEVGPDSARVMKPRQVSLRHLSGLMVRPRRRRGSSPSWRVRGGKPRDGALKGRIGVYARSLVLKARREPS